MNVMLKKLSLPEAYLDLQIEKRRSFFVYSTEITPLKRLESRLERDRAAMAAPQPLTNGHGRPAAMSVSFAAGAISGGGFVGSPAQQQLPHSDGLNSSVPVGEGAMDVVKRPRASTLPPTLASFGDHREWFDDQRFDGSFPSRVLPFLYLGNM